MAGSEAIADATATSAHEAQALPTRKPRGRSPGRPTRQKIEESNRELLDRALDLFLENGFERTTIQAITASVGMAKRTVYTRYGDKMALFKAALMGAIEDWIVPTERLRAAEADDLEESLLQIGKILVQNVLSPAGQKLMRITNAESGRLPEIGAYTSTAGTLPTIDYLADFFTRRTPAPGVAGEEARDVAEAFLYLVVGGPANMVAWGNTIGEAEVDRRTRLSVRLFLHGLLDR